MKPIWRFSALAVVAALGGCADNPGSGAPFEGVASGPALAPDAARSAAPRRAEARHDALAERLPHVVVHRSPACGCCELWVEHMRSAGFEVDVRDTTDMSAIKAEAGVPVGKGSCHTARVGDYYLEGHVPASDVKRLLAEKPAARGLLVPGMPLGSPGMESGGVRQEYEVLLLAKDGSVSVFSRHGS